MPASRATTGQSNSTMYTLIIFVVLFLIVTVLMVMQFMKNEQLVSAEQDATEAFAELATVNEYRDITPLVQKNPDGSVRATAMKQITNDMRYMAELIGGPAMSNFDILGTREKIENEAQIVQAAAAQALAASGEDPAAYLARFTDSEGSFVGMLAVLQDMSESILATRAANANLEEERDTQAADHEQAAARFQDELNQTREELGRATRVAETAEAKYKQLQQDQQNDYEAVVAQWKADNVTMQNERDEAMTKWEELDVEFARSLDEVQKLKARLSQFQPSPETEMAALEIDGHIVRVDAGQKLAYINLSNSDHIYRGLTFEVYDRYQTIPKSGQGKGSLEVIEMQDLYTKCRITDHDLTNPIMAEDAIANLVWAKDKKYLFSIAGEFDFDGDGQVDADGAARVAKLITDWGGQWQATISVSTDFLVLGHAPEVPARPSVEAIDSNNEDAAAYLEAQELLVQYEDVMADSAAQDVPTFNLERFLYFVGYYRQAKSRL